VASGSDDGTTQLWDVTGSGNPTVLRSHEGPVWDAVASRDGRRIASAGRDGTIRVQNTDGTGSPLVLHGHAGQMFGVAFSPDGTRVAGAGENGTIQIWNTNTTGDPVVLSGPPEAAPDNTVWDVTFTPDGRQVVGATIHSVFRWNADHTNNNPSQLSATSSELTNGTAPLPPDQSWRARINSGVIRTYQMARPGDPSSWRGHNGLVFHDAISVSGWQLASQRTQDNTVQLWNPEGVSHPGMLYHNGQVRSIAVSPDGRLVATTADDDTVRIWNSTGNHEPLLFHGHGISVENINFAPDGRLITTYDDGTIKIWRCEVCGPIHQVITLADKRTHD
jgi:WD40 repeat protein